MSANAIRAGRAFVEFFVKDNLTKHLDRLQARMSNFGKSLTTIGGRTAAVGAALTAPLLAAAGVFAKMGDDLNKASERTGITVEALGGLKYAAEQSGVSFEELEGSIRKMQDNLGNALAGNKAAQAAFEDLGLSLDELSEMTPDEQFKKIAEAISKIEDPSERVTKTINVLGKSGASLLPMFLDGAKGIDALIERAKKLGIVFNSEDAEAATEFGDLLADIGMQAKQVVYEFGAAVAKALIPFLKVVIDIGSKVLAWVRQNREIILLVGALAGALVAAGGALAAFGFVFQGIAMVVGVVSGAIGFLIPLLTSLPVVIGGTIAALAAWGAAAIITGKNVLDFGGIASSVFSGVKQVLGELWGVFNTTWGGIVDALSAGNFELALEIAALGAKAIWLTLTGYIKTAWAEMWGFLLNWGTHFVYDVQALWIGIKETAENLFDWLADIGVNVWFAMEDAFTDVFDSLFKYFGKAMNYAQSLWEAIKSIFSGEESTFDLDAANAEVDKAADKRVADNEKERTERARYLEDAKRMAKAKTQAEYDAQKEANEKLRQLAIDANNAKTQEEKDEIERQRKEIQDKLNGLRKKAADGKPKSESAADLSTRTPEIPDVAKTATVKSSGLFNAAGIQGLQGSETVDYLRRTAKATEQVAKNTKNSGQPTFS